MTATESALKQLDTLLDESSKVRPRASGDTSMDDTMRTLIHRLEAAIDRLSIPSGVYVRDLEEERDTGYVTCEFRLRGLVTLATALRDRIAAGWVVPVVEMAEGLSDEGYKDAAAVIAGTSLEVHTGRGTVRVSKDVQY